MPTNKNKIILIITTIVIVCIIGIFKFTEVGNYARYFLSVYDSKVKNFDKYKTDYELIVEKVIKLKDTGEITDENNDVIAEEGEMYNTFDFKEIKLTKDEKKSLKNIEKSFADDFYHLGRIIIYDDNFIAFTPSGYPFGVVYSKDGSKPNSLGLLDEENRNYKVKRLAPNWYDVEDR